MKKVKVKCKRVRSITKREDVTLFKKAYKEVFSCGSAICNYYEDPEDSIEFIIGMVYNKVVGIIEIEKHKYGRHSLNMVFVMKSYRRKGVLRAMVEYLLKKNDRLFWNAAESAIPAYRSLGAKQGNGSDFRLTRRMYNEFRGTNI